MLVRRHSRITERAGKNRVKLGRQHFERARWQGHTVAKKLFRAPVKVNELEFETFGLLQVMQQADGFAYHFRSNAVTRNDCDSFHSQQLERDAEHRHTRAAQNFLRGRAEKYFFSGS